MSEVELRRMIASLSPRRREQLASLLAPEADAVAVVGLACRLPGGEDADGFWRLLVRAGDAVSTVPPERWDAEALFDPDPAAPGKVPSRWGAFLGDVAGFDPQLFGISPREARAMDPQQRLLLETAWEAFEDAGLTLDRLAGSRTGVFVGIYQSDYSFRHFADLSRVDAYAASGISHAIAANRLSFVFDLRGPSVAMDTACSSSLVAVHAACRSLLGSESDVALAGGVNLMLSPRTNIPIGKWGMLAADGRCKTFDHRADGFVRGEGCGLLVLRRLADARRDGDPIRAVIRGSAVNQDGRTQVLTAPNGRAQVAVLREALRSARVDPSAVDYVETHGTGTKLGDPIEVEALAEVLGQRRADAPPCVLGAVKTNIGHLEAAAGVAALVKAILALERETIPPNLHLERPNPHLDLASTSFVLPTEAMRWARGARRRLAGVSAFGFGGTNAHVVLEETPLDAQETAETTVEDERAAAPRPRLFVLSAHSAPAVEARARQLETMLAEAGPESIAAPVSARDLAHTLARRRTHLDHRLAVVAASTRELGERLHELLDGASHALTARGVRSPGGAPEVVFVFTGQGSQWAGMGADLFAEPACAALLERCERSLGDSGAAAPLGDLLTDPGAGRLLRSTAHAQPAIVAVEIALCELLRTWGIEPAAVVGHSVGEIAAAYAAGVLDLDQAIRLAAHRGRAMEACAGGGGMWQVEAPADAIAAARPAGLDVAAVNEPGSCVVSGSAAAFAELAPRLAERGVRCRSLDVDYPFHSAAIDPVLDGLEAAVAGIEPAAGTVPFYSTVTGRREPAPRSLDAGYWRRGARSVVRFADAVEALLADGYRCFLEVGPRAALRASIELCARSAGVEVTALAARRSTAGRASLYAAAGALWARGVELRWDALAPPGRPVRLPAYPFQRSRFWLDAEERLPSSAEPAGHPLLGARLASAHLPNSIYQVRIDATSPRFLGDHRVHDSLIMPATAYLEMAHRAGIEVLCAERVVIEELAVREALVLPAGESRTLELAVLPDPTGESARFEIHASARTTGPAAPAAWTLYASGRLTVAREAAHRAVGAERRVELEALRAAMRDGVSGDEYYARARALGGALGPRFRGLDDVRRRDGEALARLLMSPEVREEAGDYAFHPALLDGALHLLYAALPEELADRAIYLPIRIESCRFHRSPGPRAWCHYRLRRGTGGPMVSGDVDVLDEDGTPVAEIRGAVYLPSERRSMLAAEARRLLLAPCWEPWTPAAGAALRERRWLALVCPETRAETLARTPAGTLDGVTVIPPERLTEELARRDRDEPLGVLHLAALDAETVEDTATITAEAAGVAQTCARAGRGVRLWIVTRGAQAARVGDAVGGLPQAALWGFGRSLAFEHPETFGGLVDLEPEAGAGASAGAFSADLWRSVLAGEETQLAVREGALLRARLDAGPFAGGGAFALDPAGTVLVTGGRGALGRRVAAWLVTCGARDLVLLGRSEPQAEDLALAASLAGSGAFVRHERGDVADRATVERLFAATAPGITGVVHAAGVLDDGALLNLDPDRIAAVMRPKVLGAWNLHRASLDRPLDVFLLFSSGASLLGSPGQASYAAANAFLDALAHHRRHLGMPAVSVDWGPWAEAGMAARTAERRGARWESWGLEALAPGQALHGLEAALGTGLPQVAVIAADWSRAAQALHGRTPSFLARLLPRERRADGSVLAALEASAPARRRALLTAAIRDRVAAALGLEAAAVDVHRGFFDMGMDSMTALELRDGLVSALAVVGDAVPATAIFDFPTVDRLAGHLLDDVLGMTDGSGEEPGDLDRLSQEELVELLAHELDSPERGA